MSEKSKFSLNSFTFQTDKTTAAYLPLLKYYHYNNASLNFSHTTCLGSDTQLGMN